MFVWKDSKFSIFCLKADGWSNLSVAERMLGIMFVFSLSRQLGLGENGKIGLSTEQRWIRMTQVALGMEDFLDKLEEVPITKHNIN